MNRVGALGFRRLNELLGGSEAMRCHVQRRPDYIQYTFIFLN